MGIDVKLFGEQIAKTGFVLEDRVGQQLKAAGWSVISNRYYLDDTDEATVREIDLIAYRHSKHQDFAIYTALIISCKKSDKRAWALLSRARDAADPNADWFPVHTWTNNKALRYQLGMPGVPERYHVEAGALGGGAALVSPGVEVFAFQEMDREKGTPQDDRNIFASITSLMKAQAYEMTSLPQRRKGLPAAVYQFNLLSVVDTELVRLQFVGSNVMASEVNSEHYMARYIIRKTPTVSRIRFVRAPTFEATIPEYDKLHTANVAWFTRQHAAFYEGVLEHTERIAVLIDDFRHRCGFYLAYRADKHGYQLEEKDIGLEWRDSKKMAAVTLPIDAPFSRLAELASPLDRGAAKNRLLLRHAPCRCLRRCRS